MGIGLGCRTWAGRPDHVSLAGPRDNWPEMKPLFGRVLDRLDWSTGTAIV
jgi:hypothetical protein